MQENEFQNVIFKTAAILSPLQYVNLKINLNLMNIFAK